MSGEARALRECCTYCGRPIQSYGIAYTADGPVHLGCHELTGRPNDTRPGRRRGQTPDFTAPALASQEYIRKTAFCYATLFHNPDRQRQVRPRYQRK